jgi:hypothetical protein
MPEPKAAAERLRKSADKKSHEIKIWNADNASHRQYREFLEQSVIDQILAAQALEALAWQAEKKATVQPYNGGWLCGTIDNSGHADTPLGAILAAMEGESDGK